MGSCQNVEIKMAQLLSINVRIVKKNGKINHNVIVISHHAMLDETKTIMNEKISYIQKQLSPMNRTTLASTTN
jgi:hypothetical protein